MMAILCRAIKLKEEVAKEIKSWDHDTWVLQEFIENFEVIAIDFVAQEGVIKAFLMFKAPNFNLEIAKAGYGKDMVKDEKIMEFTAKFAEFHDLSGIFEVEFMVKENGEHFIMEVNPRVSGLISNVANCDTIGGKKYTWAETIVKEYLNLVNSEMFNYGIPSYLHLKCKNVYLHGIAFGKKGFNDIVKNSFRYIFPTSQWVPSFKKSNTLI